MSQTLTTLVATTLSLAFERIESIYETLVDQTHAKLLSWGAVDADVEDLRTDITTDLIDDVRRAAGLKLALSRLIRTRPDVMPPTNLKYDTLFITSVIKLGDAVFLDDIATTVEDVLHHIEGSSWDFNAAKATVPVTEPEDALGFSNDLGEVSPGPVEPHDEDAAGQ